MWRRIRGPDLHVRHDWGSGAYSALEVVFVCLDWAWFVAAFCCSRSPCSAITRRRSGPMACTVSRSSCPDELALGLCSPAAVGAACGGDSVSRDPDAQARRCVRPHPRWPEPSLSLDEPACVPMACSVWRPGTSVGGARGGGVATHASFGAHALSESPPRVVVVSSRFPVAVSALAQAVSRPVLFPSSVSPYAPFSPLQSPVRGAGPAGGRLVACSLPLRLNSVKSEGCGVGFWCIPAFGGNTMRRRTAWKLPTVHPRAGGEHSMRRYFGVRVDGSSPRGRGTLERTAGGNIPCRRGELRTRTVPTHR